MLTCIRWQDHVLEAAHAPQFAIGARITWVVAPSHIVVHRRDRPSRGEHENPVSGVVLRCIELGETTSLSLRVGAGERADIFLSLPTHAARRNGLAQGVAASISLLRDGIHLMPAGDANP
jgi:molybdate transport system ATP-binding protein